MYGHLLRRCAPLGKVGDSALASNRTQEPGRTASSGSVFSAALAPAICRTFSARSEAGGGDGVLAARSTGSLSDRQGHSKTSWVPGMLANSRTRSLRLTALLRAVGTVPRCSSGIRPDPGEAGSSKVYDTPILAKYHPGDAKKRAVAVSGTLSSISPIAQRRLVGGAASHPTYQRRFWAFAPRRIGYPWLQIGHR